MFGILGLGFLLGIQHALEADHVAAVSSIAARRMWYDTVDYGDAPALRAAVDTLGAKQIVLGSDFPYESGKAYELCASYVRNSGLPSLDIARILSMNALGLLFPPHS